MLSDENEPFIDIQVGDYVQHLTFKELSTSPRFVTSVSMAGWTSNYAISHISGHPIFPQDYGREGYVLHIETAHIPVLYHLDSGVCAPYDALVFLRTSQKCECGKEKFQFTWHSHWCPKYTTP